MRHALALLVLAAATTAGYPQSPALVEAAAPTMKESLNSFGLRLAALAYADSKENFAYFPLITVRSAAVLGSAASGSAGKEVTAVTGFAGIGRDAEIASELSGVGNSQFNVKLTSGMLLGRGMTCEPAFVKTARDVHGVDVMAIPGSQPVEQINNWISARTGGEFKSVVDAETVKARMLLISCLQLKGEWEKPFNPKADAKMEFRGVRRTGKIDAMSGSQLVRTVRLNGVEFYGMELKGGATAYFFLPPIGKTPGDVLKKLDGPGITALAKASASRAGRQSMTVRFPKFKVNGTAELIAPLKALGVKRIFDRSAGELSFSKMTNEDIYVTAWKQTGMVEVDHFGMRGSAVEVVEARSRGAAVGDVIEFDRSFGMVTLNGGIVVSVAVVNDVVNP